MQSDLHGIPAHVPGGTGQARAGEDESRSRAYRVRAAGAMEDVPQRQQDEAHQQHAAHRSAHHGPNTTAERTLVHAVGSTIGFHAAEIVGI